MTEASATGASATAIEVLLGELEASGYTVPAELVQQIYAIEERYQFDRDRHEAPSKVKAAVSVALARMAEKDART